MWSLPTLHAKTIMKMIDDDEGAHPVKTVGGCVWTAKYKGKKLTLTDENGTVATCDHRRCQAIERRHPCDRQGSSAKNVIRDLPGSFAQRAPGFCPADPSGSRGAFLCTAILRGAGRLPRGVRPAPRLFQTMSPGSPDRPRRAFLMACAVSSIRRGTPAGLILSILVKTIW